LIWRFKKFFWVFDVRLRHLRVYAWTRRRVLLELEQGRLTMTDKKKAKELKDSQLDDVQGGAYLLLPAVQAAREANKLKTSENRNSAVTNKGFSAKPD
jgi:transposase